MAPSGEY
ncbi:hypothetical protein VTL71DRAFT_14618 [Oculimacula yallundae]